MANYLPRIEHIWAFLSVDEGGEGVVSMTTKFGHMPMVAADEMRVKQLRPIAQAVAAQTGVRIRLVKFTVREEVEEMT
jgi:hypothetical protein